MLGSAAAFALVLAALASPAQSDQPADGFTEPYRKIELAPAEPGILMDLLVEEGATVEAGQMLATLDNEVLQIAIKIARQTMESRGRLAAATAERDVRSERLKRLRSLQPDGFAFREEVERAAADLAVAEANVLAAEEQKALDALEYQKTMAMLERRTIKSPIDGVIAKVHHEAREYVSGANPVVLTVVQLNPLRVVFAVPETVALKLHADRGVIVRFPDAGIEGRGRVELVSPLTDAESGMVRVKVVLPNPQGKFRSGSRCQLVPDPGSGDTAAAAKD